MNSTDSGGATGTGAAVVPVAASMVALGEVMAGRVMTGVSSADRAMSTARASALVPRLMATMPMTSTAARAAPPVAHVSFTRPSRIGRSSQRYDASATANVTATR